MQKRFEVDDEDDEQRGVIADGGRVRVPLMVMDAVQREIAGATRVTDAAAHRPGYRTAQMRDAQDDFNHGCRVASYAVMCERLQDAWQVRDVGPAQLQHHAAQLHGLATDIEGKLAKERADEEMARERRQRNEPASDADPRLEPDVDAQGKKSAAYQASIERLSTAWQRPSGPTLMTYKPSEIRNALAVAELVKMGPPIVNTYNPTLAQTNAGKVIEQQIASARRRHAPAVDAAHAAYVARITDAWRAA